MLEHAGRIAHPLDRREIGLQRAQAMRRRLGEAARARGDGDLQLVQRRFGEPGPDHRAAAIIGTLRQPRPVALARQQAIDLTREGGDVAEVDQHAMAIRQDFGRVDVGRRNDRLADADGVGQRPARDLRGVEIGRRVDVGGLQIVEQFVMLDEAVDERDIVADAQLIGKRLQPIAIGLAFMRNEIGVGGAQHRIEQIGMPLRDRGQCLDDRLDALAGREQAEGQHDIASLPAEARLQRLRIDERAVGHAVRDHRDLARICAIDAAQDVATALGHHHDLGSAMQQAFQHATLVGVRLFQDRVQGYDDRQSRAIE